MSPEQKFNEVFKLLSELRVELASTKLPSTGWDQQSRKQARERQSIPAWVPLGDDDPDFRLLFVEGLVHAPDMEYAPMAWERIFGEKYDSFSSCKETWNGGECRDYLMPGNRVYETSFDGASIYQWLPPRKFDPTTKGSAA